MVPVQCISSMCHMYMTDFAYDGPIFLVLLSPSYPSSPVFKMHVKHLNESFGHASQTFPELKND